MSYCRNCRLTGPPGAAYCARCGSPTATAPGADAHTGGVALPSVDGRAATASAGLALLALAALPAILALVLLVAEPRTPGLGVIIGLVGSGMAAAMGGSQEFSASALGVDISFSASLMPLTSTLLALVALGAGTARSIPRALPRGRVLTAWTVRQALLTLALFVGGLLLVVVIAEAALAVSSGSAAAPGLAGVRISLGLGTTLLGSVLLGALAIALALCWARPDTLPHGLRAVRDLVAGAATSAGVALMLLAPAIVVGLVSAVVASGGLSSGSEFLGLVVIVVLWAPNLVLLTIGFACGVPVTLDLPALGPLLSTGGIPTSVGLLDAARASALAWLLPALVAACLVLGAIRGAFVSQDRYVALARSWLLAPVWAAVLLAAGLFTAIRAGGTLPLPFLGASAIDVSVHLSYGLALLAGLIWGVLAGPLGALLARVLPAEVALGYRSTVARRRAATTAAVVAAVCLLTASTAAASVVSFGPASSPDPIPTPLPTTSTVPRTSTDPDPYRVPTTTPPVPVVPTSPSEVTLGASATDHPDAAAVQSVLESYFAAINQHDYDAWRSAVTPQLAADQPRDSWEQGYRSTQDDQIVVENIQSSGGVYAQVSFRSTQDPADAPPDLPVSSICWSMTYPVDLTDAQVGKPVRGTVTKQAC